MLEERVRLCKDLWIAGINSEFGYKQKSKILDQFTYCETNSVPLIAIIGKERLQQQSIHSIIFAQANDRLCVPRACRVD